MASCCCCCWPTPHQGMASWDAAERTNEVIRRFTEWCTEVASADVRKLQEASQVLGVEVDIHDIDGSRRRLMAEVITELDRVKKEALPRQYLQEDARSGNKN